MRITHGFHCIDRSIEIFLDKKIVVPYRSKLNTFSYNEQSGFLELTLIQLQKKQMIFHLKLY